TGINMNQFCIHRGVQFQKCCWGAFCMSGCMESIHHKLSVCKEFRLARPAVRSECTSKVIYNPRGRLGPSGDEGGEGIITALSQRYAMKPIADAMSTPACHYTPC
ncbi:hypothetical protein GYMLUDRAFT_175994, partial [Collybiopsis luxurians FD-317 M1]